MQECLPVRWTMLVVIWNIDIVSAFCDDAAELDHVSV